MPQATNRRSIGIPSLHTQLMKRYFVYDANDRVQYVYEAVTEAGHGDSCILSTYEYTTPTSFKVAKMKEDVASWDSAWDV